MRAAPVMRRIRRWLVGEPQTPERQRELSEQIVAERMAKRAKAEARRGPTPWRRLVDAVTMFALAAIIVLFAASMLLLLADFVGLTERLDDATFVVWIAVGAGLTAAVWGATEGQRK